MSCIIVGDVYNIYFDQKERNRGTVQIQLNKEGEETKYVTIHETDSKVEREATFRIKVRMNLLVLHKKFIIVVSNRKVLSDEP